MASAFSAASGSDLTKRQIYYGAGPDFVNGVPYPDGNFGYGYGYQSRPWVIATSAAIGGVVFLLLLSCLYVHIKRRRARGKKPTLPKTLPNVLTHQRSNSGISEDDPDNIKPVKRLRSFHMKSPTSPGAKSSNSAAGLFAKLFRRGTGHKPLPTLDEESLHGNDSYAHLNRAMDTPGLDEKMLEASPPPTPQPAFGWSSNAAAANKRRSVSETLRDTSTAYKSDTPPAGQQENDSFLQGGNNVLGKQDNASKKRMSQGFDDNYQTKPVGGYFDDEDGPNGPPAYDPDTRSGR